MKKKTTTIFVSVSANDDFRSDVYHLDGTDEIIGYIAKNYKASDLTLLEDCPLDEDVLNEWDDDILEAEIFTEEEYEAAIKEMNELLGVEDFDTFIKEHWAVEVECSREKVEEMLKQC